MWCFPLTKQLVWRFWQSLEWCVQLNFAICSWVKKEEKMSRKTHLAAFVLYYVLMMSLENWWADEVVEANCFLFMQSVSWRPSAWKFGEEQSRKYFQFCSLLWGQRCICSTCVSFSGLNALAKCQDAMLSKHTNTLTATTFRPWKQKAQHLESVITPSVCPILYSANKTVKLWVCLTSLVTCRWPWCYAK